MPKLAVIMSNYNHAAHLPAALESLRAQTFRDFEVFIIDDGSTDQSLEVLRAIAAIDPRFTIRASPTNRGLMANVPDLMAMASAPYLHWFASDDVLEPTFFECAVQALDSHPMAAFAFGAFEYLHEDTGRREPRYFAKTPSARYFSPSDYARQAALSDGIAIGLVAVLRRTAVDAFGGFPTELRWYTDWFCLQALAFRHGACVLPGIVGTYRIVANAYHVVGPRSRQRQEQLIGSALQRLLAPPLSETLPFWKASGAFGEMGRYTVTTVLADARYWNRDVFTLVFSGVRAKMFSMLRRAMRRI
ncbi:MAG: glycosyltransferase family A protein [Sulfuritalea sp.]|nr:glycosyltransferase family A protein [Sulfuritalea sp.]